MSKAHARSKSVDRSANRREARRNRAPNGGVPPPAEPAAEDAERQLKELRQVLLDPKAIADPVRESLRIAVRENRDALAEIISPSLGPALRQAVLRSLRRTSDRFHRHVQRNLDPRRALWRLEAALSGRPWEEVASARDLVYRVEQVLLLHRSSGLVVGHAANRSARQAPEIVAGLLTGVRDALRDSPTAERDGARRIEIGDRTVWVEQQGPAILAAVVYGAGTAELGAKLRGTLAQVVADLGPRWGALDGDPRPSAEVEPALRRCLHAQCKAPERSSPWSLYVIVALALLAGTVLGARHLQWRAAAASAVETVAAEPGYQVLQHRIGWWRLHLTGLRDPLARPPTTVLAGALEPGDMDARWGASADPRLALPRAREVLAPPAGVDLDLSEDGTLVVTGTAAAAWRRGLARLGRTIPGVTRVDLTGLRDAEAQALQRAAARVQALRVRFAANEDTPLDPEEITKLQAALRELDRAAWRSGARVHLFIEGSADSSGREALNRALSRDRALNVAQTLAALSLWRIRWSARSVWAKREADAEATDEDRAVRFRVRTRPPP